MSRYWSLMRAETSYGQKFVSTGNLVQNIWQKVKKDHETLTFAFA